MAQYSHLPIYNVAFDLLKELYRRVPKFTKQYKYFLGGRIIGYNVDIISLIIQANSEKDAQRRKYFLDELINIIELLTIHLRMANELKQLGTQKAYLYLSEKAVVLSKQAEGWKKYMPQNSQSA
ncbi:MAG: four helix bundle protein [bacterium]|nr:four helix bundle protein [bacterium]